MPGTDRDALLIVGATGRVGRMLARHWERQPPARRVICQARGRLPGPGWVSWDPMDTGAATLPEGIATMVVLAGVTPAPGAMLDANAGIARACLEAARAAGVPRILYASSQAVYGAPRGRAFREMDAPAPVSDYGRAKAEAEAACEAARAGGMQVCAMRIGNVAGADMLLINAATATEQAPVLLDRFADGRGPRRSYIATDALARVILTLAETPDLPPVLNVAAPAPVAMEALLQAARAPWRFVPAPSGAVQDVTIDTSALAALVPFTPEDSAPGAIARVWQATRDTA